MWGVEIYDQYVILEITTIITTKINYNEFDYHVVMTRNNNII